MDHQDREYVQSLERGLNVIRAFDAEHRSMTLSQVAARAKLTRASARRFLLTLVALDLVATDGRNFWLLPRVLDLGFRYLSTLPWWQTAQPVIEDISGQLQEACSISILDGSEIVYVCRASVNRILSANISIGSRFPAFCTAMGRALLASMPDEEIERFLAGADLVKYTPSTIIDKKKLKSIIIESRRKKHAVSNGELESSLRGLAVPIADHAGRVFASLGVSAHEAVESEDEFLKRCLPVLFEGARRIAHSIPTV